MRVSVTERQAGYDPDLRPAGELAPSLVLPWIVRLRYAIVAGQAALAAFTHFGVGVRLPLAWMALPLGVNAASNLAPGLLARRFSARSTLGLLLTLDVVCLTATIALSGGPANPFTLLYLVQITLSAVV